MKNLSVGYPNRVVLENADIVLPAGKISVILGGSGVGKSTLLKHLLGLSSPLAGEIFVGNKNLFTMSDEEFYQYKRSMGVLFQDGALLGSLTVAENVSLPLLEHTEQDEETTNMMATMKLAMVGLQGVNSYYPNELSGGMRKRAGLARALVMDPALLLCDEPSSGLDPITAAEIDQLIIDLRNTLDITIVVVSHDLDSLKTIAEHVVVLHDKRVCFEGPLKKLLATEDTYLRQFLDRIPSRSHTPKWFEGVCKDTSLDSDGSMHRALQNGKSGGDIC